MSKLIPSNWSVVVAGKWNRSILTPKGIGRYVFELDNNQNVSVLIPLDAYPIPIVNHPDCAINAKADQDRLFIGLGEEKYDLFVRAGTIGSNAITNLPVTPLSAAGFNVDFRSDGVVDGIIELLKNDDADDALIDQNMIVASREIRRSAGFDDGLLNLAVKAEVGGGCSLRFNFHKAATDADALRQWLRDVPVKMEAVVHELVDNLGLVDEIEWGETDGE